MVSFFSGVKDIFPILLGIAPFGVLYGATAISAGLDKLQSLLMSVIIFAGASQIVLLDQIKKNTPFITILLVMFLINLRMALYSVSMAQHIKRESLITRLLGAYLLTDEAYAVSANRFNDSNIKKMPYYFGAAVSVWVTWQLSTAAGVFLGNQLPQHLSLDFAIPLTFLALLINFLKKKKFLIAAITTGIAMVMFKNLPYNTGFFVAVFLGIASATIYTRFINE
jgi:4-azaleucine resistance transporter AzlC